MEQKQWSYKHIEVKIQRENEKEKKNLSKLRLCHEDWNDTLCSRGIKK